METLLVLVSILTLLKLIEVIILTVAVSSFIVNKNLEQLFHDLQG